MTTQPTQVDLAAQWHEKQRANPDHDSISCWCCCMTCPDENPDFALAEQELREQMRKKWG